MKKIFFVVLCLLLLANNSFAQSFDATVNRTTLPEGETIVLSLELKDADTTASPDLSSLSSDFTVLSISNGYRTQIINNNVSKSRQWNLVMIPNKTGNLIIPAIKLADFETKPISVKVITAGTQDKLDTTVAQNQPKFKISGKVDNLSPYVQQQINYQLKIYDAGGLQGEAPFFAVKDDTWIIRSLGAPKIETKIINGQNLREITFSYALFAQKSGELTIPEVKFNGYYLTQNTRTDPFARFFDDDEFFSGFGLNNVFATKQPVMLSAKPIKVDVKPAPASASGWWLPAKDIKLSAEFENRPPQFRVGEPINRTIYLKAIGVIDNQLPDINFVNVDGLKQYPEKPITEMKVEDSEVVSLAKINNVYIPQQAGPIVLPSIDIKWFNTSTGSFETASIPEYKTTVLQASGNIETQAEDILSVQPQNQPKQVEDTSIASSNTINNTQIIILLVGAFAIGIILTLALTKIFAFLDNRSKHRNTVISAAKLHDLHLLRDSLIAWGQRHYPHHHIANLQDVADIFNNPIFNKELDKIRETLYAQDEKDWNHEEFLKIFRHVAKKATGKLSKKHAPLPKLYK